MDTDAWAGLFITIIGLILVLLGLAFGVNNLIIVGRWFLVPFIMLVLLGSITVVCLMPLLNLGEILSKGEAEYVNLTYISLIMGIILSFGIFLHIIALIFVFMNVIPNLLILCLRRKNVKLGRTC